MRRLARLVTAVGIGSAMFGLACRASAQDAPQKGAESAAASPAGVATAASFADAAAAMAYLEGVNWNGGGLDTEKRDSAEAVLKTAAEQEPTVARWQTGLAMIGVTKRDLKAAKAHAEKAVELDPKSAEAQYWLGNALFNDINNVGMMDKMSYASKGRKAYERAIEADAKHIGARIGLIQFYLNAPGIAGGSVKKARELAKELVAIPGGELLGHMNLAVADAKDGKHDAAASEFDAALAAAKDDADRRTVLFARANSLVRDKKDYAAALVVAEEILPIAGDREPTLRYMMGDAKRQQKDYAGAVEQFSLVLAKNPDAQNTRYGLAQAYESLEKWADAAREYDEFARRFPKDDRAGDATKAAGKMRKKAEKAAKPAG